jgi:3',5'-cyclic-AMP phosphodiesterase
LPHHLPPISRRGFLLGTAAAAASVIASSSALGRVLPAAGSVVERVALLSDTHISANPLVALVGKAKAGNLRRIVRNVLELPTKPACVVVNGDCAFGAGHRSDYARFFKLLNPFQEAGLAVHMAMGNHDDRDNFWHALPDDARATSVRDRQVSLVPLQLADLYLLDSLDVTNKEPGRLGEAQLKWLAASLDARRHRPAVVFAHHPPTRIRDQRNVLEVLSPRRQVKAMFYGHTHNWSVTRHRGDGLHLINLPPTSYVFDDTRPVGWVDLQLTARSATVGLVSLDPTHPQHAETHELRWRV